MSIAQAPRPKPARAHPSGPLSAPAAMALLSAMALLAACAGPAPDQPLRVASGLTSHLLCSETFLSGQDPDRIFRERIAETGAYPWIAWAVDYRLDRARHAVTTRIGGLYESRAVFDPGLGCVLVHDDRPMDRPPPEALAVDPAPPDLPAIAGPDIVPPRDPALVRALDHAFAEPAEGPRHRVTAVVIVHHGRIVGERYAPGYGVDVPVLGFSVTKSVTSALIGILARQGRLRLDQPPGFAAWSGPADPRHAITLEQILRQTTGIDLPETNTGFDRSTRMQFLERDTAGYAQSVPLATPPGTAWAYTDGNYALASRVLRDAVGGDATAVARFARRELFQPLGMDHALIEMDATGTPLGATHAFASPRDFARFGLLYLRDGMAGGRRILPEGWVRLSATPTLDTGYGAGFWTNRRPGLVPGWGVPWGMASAPADTIFARGFMGQYVIVVPSRDLVVTRFGLSHVRGDDIEAVDAMMAEILAALPSPASGDQSVNSASSGAK